MFCPFCRSSADTRVVDSRPAAEGYSVRRRRECPQCQARFTTFETVEVALPVVVKRDGRREPFDLTKLQNGLSRALEKRPIPTVAVDKALNDILQRVREVTEREINASMLGEWVMTVLRDLDQVAYVRFASVYLSFQDLNAFRQEIARLEKN